MINEPLNNKTDKKNDLENKELNDSTAKDFFKNSNFLYEPGRVFYYCHNPSIYYPISFAMIISIIMSILSFCAFQLEVKNSLFFIIYALIVFFINLCIFIALKSETVIDYANNKIYKRNHLFSFCFSDNSISFNDIKSIGIKNYRYKRTAGKGIKTTYYYHLSRIYFALFNGSTYNFNDLENNKSIANEIIANSIALALKKQKLQNKPVDNFNNKKDNYEDQYNKYLSDGLLEILKFIPAYLLVSILLTIIYLPMYFLIK